MSAQAAQSEKTHAQLFYPSYPLIDSDPHFNRVVRYLRPTDYAVWAGFTVAAPAIFSLWDRVDFAGGTAKQLRAGMRLSALGGFVGGFLYVYQQSSLRFWGWKENAREDAKDRAELSSRVQKGLPIYGASQLEPYMQGVAARNSTGSQLFLGILPMFNLVNHNNHGVDVTERYGAPKST